MVFSKPSVLFAPKPKQSMGTQLWKREIENACDSFLGLEFPHVAIFNFYMQRNIFD